MAKHLQELLPRSQPPLGNGRRTALLRAMAQSCGATISTPVLTPATRD